MDEELNELSDDLVLRVPKPSGPVPDCPFCGEPMQLVDADYLCIDCNGTDVGPETG
jgi:hypothetical protein